MAAPLNHRVRCNYTLREAVELLKIRNQENGRVEFELEDEDDAPRRVSDSDIVKEEEEQSNADDDVQASQ